MTARKQHRAKWHDVPDGAVNEWWWFCPEWIEADPEMVSTAAWLAEDSDQMQMCLFRATRFVAGGG